MNKEAKENLGLILTTVGFIIAIGGGIYFGLRGANGHPQQTDSAPSPPEAPPINPRKYTKYEYHHDDSIYVYSIKFDTVMVDNTVPDEPDHPEEDE